MPDADEDRRYTDEFAEIVRTAAELEREPGARRRGLTLEQIHSIASEAGLDPEAVTRAARSMDRRGGGFLARLVGGAMVYRFARVIPVAASRDRYPDLLDTIRDLTGNLGEATEVAGGLEWKSEGSVDQIHVDISPRSDRTRITVRGDRTTPAILSTMMPAGAWAIAFGVTSAVIDPSTAAEVVALAAGYGVAAVAAGRTAWSRTGERLRRRLLALVEELALEASR